jgi:hypothetical protein
MKRWLSFMLLALAALALAAVGAADPGEGKGKHKGQSKQKAGKMSFTVTTTDNGSCGAAWANSVLHRTFHVKDNGDGTFTLTRRDRGTFTTIGGASPGACDTTGKHGHTVLPGVKGKLVGYLRGTVSGGTFNPNARCTAPAGECGFTDVFLATFFGPSYQFSCWTNSADCKFNYNYTAPRGGTPLKLVYRHWQDKGKGAGTMLQEEFIGDIANT